MGKGIYLFYACYLLSHHPLPSTKNLANNRLRRKVSTFFNSSLAEKILFFLFIKMMRFYR